MTLARTYQRYSPRPNAERSRSNEQQGEMVALLAAEKDLTIADTYADPDTSGSPTDELAMTPAEMLRDRPDLNRLLMDLQPGEWMLAYSLDRISRNVGLWDMVSKVLRRKRAFLATCSERNLDLSDYETRLILTIRTAMAEWQRYSIGKQTRDHMLIMQASGRLVGGTPPIGTRKGEWVPIEGHQKGGYWTLVPDEGEMALVREVLQMHEAGLGRAEIVWHLLRGPWQCRGREPSEQMVRSILKRYANNGE